MFHTCDQRFDVTGNLENFCELNKALIAATTVYNIHSGDFAAPVKKKEQIRCSTRLLLEFATHRFDNSEPKIQRNERKQLQAEDIDRVHCYMSTSPFGLELDPEIQWNERKLKIESPLHPL